MEPRCGLPWGLLARLGEDALSKEELAAIMPLLEGDPVEPPESVIARASHIPGQRTPDRAERTGLSLRLVAQLAFDSRTVPQPVGLRTVPDLAHRLIYTAGTVRIQLEMREGPDGRCAVAGQVLTPRRGPWEIRLYQEHTEQEHTERLRYQEATSELGYFVLDDVTPGTYTLTGERERVEVHIGGLTIGPAG